MSGVADIHNTTLVPSKLELVQAWLPTQPWFDGDAGALQQVGSYRFVDPAGEVGIENLLLSDGSTTWHVPLTYRSAPLTGGELVGTMEHGVLGTRYAHLGTTDPVWIDVVRTAVAAGDTNAALSTGTQPTAQARATGLVSPAPSHELQVEVSHRADQPVAGHAVLHVTWVEAERPRQADLIAVQRA